MRIAVLVPTPPWVVRSGLETVAFEMAKGLVALGHDVDMICLAEGKRRIEERDGMRVFYLGKKLRTGVLALDHLLNSLTHFLTSHVGMERDYDVLFVHKGIAVPQMLWRIPSVKYSYGEFIHWSPVTLTNTAIDVFDIYSSKLTIACSRFAFNQIRKFPGMGGRVSIVTPGTHTKLFRPAKRNAGLKARLGLKNEKVVIFVGRVTASKGCDQLVDMARLVVDEVPAAKFLFVGKYDKQYRRYLVEKARGLGIENSLVFSSDVDYYDIPKYYALADVQVLPSPIEAFGMVNVEAQSCGLPSVAYDVGGVSSSIRNGVTGYLVKKGDKRAFASKIIFLLRNPRAMRRMGANGRKRAKNEFDWAVISSGVERILRRVARAP